MFLHLTMMTAGLGPAKAVTFAISVTLSGLLIDTQIFTFGERTQASAAHSRRCRPRSTRKGH
jgi:hypothetical protein